MKIIIKSEEKRIIKVELWEIKKILIDYLIKNNIIGCDDIAEEPYVVYETLPDSDNKFMIGINIPIMLKAHITKEERSLIKE